MDLFLDNPNGLPKIAAAMSRLSENPDDWNTEIINELLRQAPYAGDFSLRIIMNELDSERRYALGAIEVKSSQASNPRDNKLAPENQGVKQVLIPIIVKEGKMSPLDVFLHNGKAQPLTEQRLRIAMFRPQLFEGIGKRPGDQDIMNTLFPPYRSGGFGIGGNSYVGTHESSKFSSVNSGIINEIHHTIKQDDFNKVENSLNNDPTLRAAVMNNPASYSFMLKLAEQIKRVEAEYMCKQAMQAIPPKVVQVQHVGGVFKIKTANPNALLLQENDVDRPTAESIVGADIVREVERDGTITISTEPVVKNTLVGLKVGAASEFGEWKVKTKDGKELVGWVFPRCVDLDGTNMALSIFSNGSESALQENIAGSLVGKGTNLIDEPPSGFGCFYLARAGSVQAIVPLKIISEAQDVDGTKSYQGDTILGENVQIRLVNGLNRIVNVINGIYGIPADCGWLPMRNMINLAEDASQFTKTAEALQVANQIELMTDGNTYSMRGLGVTKLAKVLPTEFINSDQALFNLAILGLNSSDAKEKLAEAHKISKWVGINGVRPIILAVERFEKAKIAAKEKISKMPAIKALLLKEAAVLDDPTSVDRVLSTGFINPENIGIFVSHIPDFEDTLQNLSQLLITSRLGLSVVDVGALERVVKHLDKVLIGLRELSRHPQV